ncbi:unnamed protein product [Gadus morhua 'NCC']
MLSHTHKGKVKTPIAGPFAQQDPAPKPQEGDRTAGLQPPPERLLQPTGGAAQLLSDAGQMFPATRCSRTGRSSQLTRLAPETREEEVQGPPRSHRSRAPNLHPHPRRAARAPGRPLPGHTEGQTEASLHSVP